MQSEIPGNVDWKNKLEELEGFESDVFDKDALWNKLHVRLQPKKKNKKIIWYWIAAACLFFALFLSFLFGNKKEDVLVKNNLSLKNVKSSSSQKPIVNEEVSNIISSSNKNKQPVIFSINNDKINAPINHKIKKPKLIANKNEKKEIAIYKLNDKAVMPMDTTISIAINLPEKKKLKVVHVNELGGPVVEIANTARVYDRHNFQFKFMNQQVSTSPSYSSNNKPLKIFSSRKFQ